MQALDVGGSAGRIESFVEQHGELVRHLLLQHGGTRQQLRQPRQLRDAEHFLGGNVGDRDAIDDGEQVVGADTEGDIVLRDHHLLVLGGKALGQKLVDPLLDAVVTADQLRQPAGGAFGGALEVGIGRGVIAEQV